MPNPAAKPEQTIARLKAELAEVHAELQNANSDLIQLTLELEDRVDERTRALRKSEKELRRHRDHLQELVNERTRELRRVNETLQGNLDELKASEERFCSLVVTLPANFYRIDRNGYFTFINDAILKLGYDCAELQGKHFSEIVRPADVDRISRKKVLPQYSGLAADGDKSPKLFDERRTGTRRTTALEVRLVTKKQKLRPGLLEGIGPEEIMVEINAAGLYQSMRHGNAQKVFIGTVGVIRDITGRKKIENALQESQERLKTILDCAQAGIVVVDAEKRRIVEANPAALALIGADRRTVVGTVCHRFICPEQRDSCPVLDQGRTIDNTERTLRQADGTDLPILKTVAPIQLNGRPHLLESFVDIRKLKAVEAELTEAKEGLERKVQERTAALKNSQARLIQSEKIAALGTLTAGIAHELNNPMMGMLNFIQYCLRHTDPGRPTHNVLQDAEHETRRCIKIVQNLLTFSRIENQENEGSQPASLERLFDRVCRLLAYRIEKQGVTVVKDVAPALPDVTVKVSNIQQVLLNLVGNALDAMQETPARELRLTLHRRDGWLCVTLQDTGCGIPPEKLDSIFDPFFTTKPVGRGTGLGLSVSQGIIQDHGGTIHCESREGRGSTFTIQLPVITSVHP